MNRLIPLYVTVTTIFLERVERAKARDNRGVAILEYAALLVLAGALIGVLYRAGLVRVFGEKMQWVMQNIFGQAK